MYTEQSRQKISKNSLLISDLKRALSEPNVDFVQLEQRVDNGSTVMITDDEINQLRSGSNKKVKDDNGKPDDDIDYLPPKVGNAVTIGSVVAGIVALIIVAAIVTSFVFSMVNSNKISYRIQLQAVMWKQLLILRRQKFLT